MRADDLRVLLVWHGAAGGAYTRRFEALTQQRVRLDVVAPESWWENGLLLKTLPTSTPAYTLRPLPAAYPRHGSLHFYRCDLRVVLDETRPDVVHIHEEPFSLVTAQVAWATRRYRPSAALVVESWQNLYKRFPPPFCWIERWTLRNADHFIAGSQEIRDVLVRKGVRAPVSVVPLATDTANFRRLQDVGLRRELAGEAEFVIGYVGRLVPEKGLGLLLEASAGMEGNWAALLVGEGPEKEKLEELSKRLGIRHRVRFVGNVSHRELPAVMSAMDVLVLPSVTTSHWKEQFGRVLIEAMACEVPVVGSSSGEIPNVIGDAGLVFPEGEADKLRACLERLWHSPELRTSLAQKGLTRVRQRFTWERVAEQTLAVYQEAVSRRQGKRGQDA